MSMQINQDQFRQEVLESPIPVLVDFNAQWCGPCRMLAPILDQIAQENQGKIKVCKIDTDQNTALAVQMGISSIPAVFAFKDGQLVGKSIGLVNKQTLLDLLK